MLLLGGAVMVRSMATIGVIMVPQVGCIDTEIEIETLHKGTGQRVYDLQAAVSLVTDN